MRVSFSMFPGSEFILIHIFTSGCLVFNNLKINRGRRERERDEKHKVQSILLIIVS